MTITPVRDHPLYELGRQWADAQQQGDAQTLDTLATDSFLLVGPRGAVLVVSPGTASSSEPRTAASRSRSRVRRRRSRSRSWRWARKVSTGSGSCSSSRAATRARLIPVRRSASARYSRVTWSGPYRQCPFTERLALTNPLASQWRSIRTDSPLACASCPTVQDGGRVLSFSASMLRTVEPHTV